MEPSQIGLLMLVIVAITGSLISLLDHRIKPERPPADDGLTPPANANDRSG